MSEKREWLSKKLRFDVFKRDLFTCQYCGAFPPNVVLEIDHILPVSKNGKSNIDNLITSCFECNRGKTNNLLTVKPVSVLEKTEILREKLEQTKAYDRFIKKQIKLIDGFVDDIESVFESYYSEKGFTSQFKNSIKIFLKHIPCHELIDHMHRACGLIRYDPTRCLKYFCGICWGIIKNK